MITPEMYTGTPTSPIGISNNCGSIRTIDCRLYFIDGRLCIRDAYTDNPIDVTDEIKRILKED